MAPEGRKGDIEIVFLNKVNFNDTQKPNSPQTAVSCKESEMIQSLSIE